APALPPYSATTCPCPSPVWIVCISTATCRSSRRLATSAPSVASNSTRPSLRQPSSDRCWSASPTMSSASPASDAIPIIHFSRGQKKGSHRCPAPRRLRCRRRRGVHRHRSGEGDQLQRPETHFRAGRELHLLAPAGLCQPGVLLHP